MNFSQPTIDERELAAISKALRLGHLSGDGEFSQKCHELLNELLGTKSALLTHSCTGALEMAAILIGIKKGDEVIMPSFTFSSTANAVILRGGTPVFVDIRPDTLNIDENLIEGALSENTKMLMPVHYAGVSCEMDTILEIGNKNNIPIVEDAAQSFLSEYKGKPLGSIGQMAALSFHESKNVVSGEGGALLINDKRLIKRAEIIREKGTNRGQFFRGEIDKYTWIDIGSSYLPSEITAAFLYTQLKKSKDIVKKRMRVWELYHNAFTDLEDNGHLRRPIIPQGCIHNAHIYYLLLPTEKKRNSILNKLNSSGIPAVFHYVPLHSAPAGIKYCRTTGTLNNTTELAARLIRLPLYAHMNDEDVEKVIEEVRNSIHMGV